MPNKADIKQRWVLHRIGGLEILLYMPLALSSVLHRIGGLEILLEVDPQFGIVLHRIGGLEIC